MARDFAKKFYNSKAWKNVREAYIAMRFGVCERCGQPNCKQVHHKKYLTPENIDNPDVALNFSNLELLCDTCHQLEHNEKYSPIRMGLMFDTNGCIVKR